ncbi:MAG TPA: FGGY-family carbohydrate kinase [Anaerolineaceae bacterium]|nr:FGGY-family carbohydrate kinase [Anaerolineaceae bacterium]
MGPYFLGIDNGNTVSKAALFNASGKEIAIASCKVDTIYPHPGWTERDMEQLWQSTASAVREVLAASGVRPQEIAGVGCTGHGNGLYLLDQQGRPLRNGIQSMDSRAAGIVAEWSRRGLHAAVFPYTIQSFWPAQPNALLAWIKQNEPENYERIGAILMCKDYIKYRLTGEVSTDFTDMSATSLLDVRNRCYSPALMALYDLSEIYEALPPLRQSFEVAGQVSRAAAEATGLAAGTPVVGGMFDVDGSAIGCGAVHPGQACIVAGTWSINEVITADPLVDPNLFMTTLFADPGRYLTIEASATSATNLEWFVNQCCGDERAEARRRGISVYEICSEEVASLPPGSTSIVFHPFLYGSNVQPTARAGFYGLAGWHTRAHLLRALYEGVVFCHLSHIEKLRAAGAQIQSARLTGGGSRSQVWTQMFADAIQVPVEISDGAEVGARGAALSAGIGAGVYRDYAEAAEQAVSIVRVQEPIPANTPLYLERYAAYQRLVQVMQEPWEALNRLG